MTKYNGNDIYCDEIIPRNIKIKVIKETESVLAYYHTKPHWPTHIVVTTKKHVSSLLELQNESNELVQELLQVITEVASEVKEKQGACRVLTNLGTYQDSKHLHFHIYSQ